MLKKKKKKSLLKLEESSVEIIPAVEIKCKEHPHLNLSFSFILGGKHA